MAKGNSSQDSLEEGQPKEKKAKLGAQASRTHSLRSSRGRGRGLEGSI